MKKTRYTFTVLRYIHDVVTGEFANVGVLLYAPEVKFLEARCVGTYGRLAAFFGVVDGEHFKRVMGHVAGSVAVLGEQLFTRLPMFGGAPKDVIGCAREILPADDSSLQFSMPGSGLTADPAEVLRQLYERFVERYGKRPQPDTRQDSEVWPVFRRALGERQILSRLHPKRIVAPDYEHEFPHAWKDGTWNTAEAISLDMAAAGDILEKANRWLGRGVNLSDSSEPFKLYLLVGRPSLEKLKVTYAKATNILHKMPCPHELIPEDQAPAFAEMVAADLREHERDDY